MKRCTRTVESESSISTGNVGIWWFYNDTVVGEYCLIDEAVQDDWCIHIDYSNTNYPMFPDGVSTSDTHRFGQVIYDARSQVFEILYYSSDWKPSMTEIGLIASYFGIQDLRYDVIDGDKQVPCFTWEISPKDTNKPVMNAAQKQGYDMAMKISKKYPKAMKVLGG